MTLPYRPGGWAPADVEQGADFRQPRGESKPAPAPAGGPLAPAASPSQSRTAISGRYHHGLRIVQGSSPPSPTARCASVSTWAVVIVGLALASDTVFLYGVP